MFVCSLPGVLRRNGDIAQRTEAGGDPVDAPPLPHPALHQRPPLRDAPLGAGGELHARPVPRHPDQVFKAQRVHVE